MKIGFFGDTHGCVRHALGAAVLLARHRGPLDALIQVGDLGAFPSADRWDKASRRHGADAPAQHDFFALLDPSPSLTAGVERALAEIPPFTFVSGNHEDHDWLAGLHAAASETLVAVDPLGAFRHVPDGEIVEIAGLRTAFLGRIDAPDTPVDYDHDAYRTLLDVEPGTVDLLVTHDGPHGLSTDFHGQVQGSALLTTLIDRLQPALHLSGHYHHENGPRRYGRTVSYALGLLVPPHASRRDPGAANPGQRVAAGSIALLDTDSGLVEYVHDWWLAMVRGDDLDLTALLG
jgi:hypothetical protein